MAVAPRHVRSHRRSLTLQAVPPAGQYSVAKFLDLHAYIARVTPWRAFVVLATTPLPGLAAALIPALLPLQPLRDGATWSFYAHVFLIAVFATIGAVLPTLMVTDVPSSTYSPREVVTVAVCSSAFLVSIVYILATSWRFPVPFFWVMGALLWVLVATFAHILVLGRKCWQKPELARAVRLYGLGLLLQVAQIAVYPAVSVLFDQVTGGYQIVLTLLFPLVKIAIKWALKWATLGLQDQHGVVVVAAVEICASMYQSMVMQSAPSHIAIAVIMAIDLVQGVLAIKLFLDRPSDVPKHQLVAEALELIRSRRSAKEPKSKRSKTRAASIVPASSRPGPMVRDINKSNRLSKNNLPREATTRGRRLIYQALQVTHVAETILLVEYFEVVVPLVNCAFLAAVAPLRSSFYNTKLHVLHTDSSRVRSALASILLYALLQGVSCAAMHWLMKRRYGLSATAQLAFVLERHRVAIQGKMVAWLPVVLHFTLAHYGTDFSFQFDFAQWEQW